MDLLEAFPLPAAGGTSLVGAGGKTTLMYALAAAHVRAGRSVVTTTTTRIRPPEPEQSPCLLTGEPDPLLARLPAALAGQRHVTVAAAWSEGRDKLCGLAPDDVARLVATRLADVVIVEADGSAGRPLKAHDAHEPALPPGPGDVVAVVGAAAFGAPLDDAHVHRAALAAGRLGLPAGARVTPAIVAALLLHPEGWFARLGVGRPATLFVAGAAAGAPLAAARELAAALAADPVGRAIRVLAGDVPAGRFTLLAR